MYVQAFMTMDPVTVTPSTDVAEAIRQMKRANCRRLPVLDNGRLVGIVTLHDMYGILPHHVNPAKADLAPGLESGIAVGDVMTRDVITAEPTEPLEEVAERMRRNRVGGIPVVHRGVLVGIITESDIFRVFTQLMGGQYGGVRISLEVQPEPMSLHKLLEFAGVYAIRIISLSMFRSEAGDRILVTMRVAGEDIERFLNSLWNAGYRVTGVLHGGRDAPGR